MCLPMFFLPVVLPVSVPVLLPVIFFVQVEHEREELQQTLTSLRVKLAAMQAYLQ